MTRKAKEKRQERVQEKQRTLERLLLREQTLSARGDWRALLQRIDGDSDAAQAVVSPRHRIRSDDPSSGAAISSSSKANSNAVAETVQWKSTNVPVAAAGVFQLPIKVDAPRATLTYEFSTREFDLNFGIHAIGASDGAMHELVPTSRYESHRERVRGSLVLAGPAMALLVWDNSFSWLNPKQLAYTVELQQDFPEPAETIVSPEQRTALALHERAKREQLRIHREASCADFEATRQTHERQIAFIEHQIEELRKSLEATEALKQKAAEDKEAVEEEMDALTWEIDALLWRSMGTAVINKIFTFCEERELTAWSITNHQWHSRITSFRDAEAQAASASEVSTTAG